MQTQLASWQIKHLSLCAVHAWGTCCSDVFRSYSAVLLHLQGCLPKACH